jgi:hypothetical protein
MLVGSPPEWNDGVGRCVEYAMPKLVCMEALTKTGEWPANCSHVRVVTVSHHRGAHAKQPPGKK